MKKFSFLKHQSKSLTFEPKRKEKKKKSQEIKIDKKSKEFFNSRKFPLKSDNKIINYSETISKLIGQLNSKLKKTSSRNNNFKDISFHDSNSSEIGDDKESEEIKNNIIKSPKKIKGLSRVLTLDNNNKKNGNKKNDKIDDNIINEKASLKKIKISPTLTFRENPQKTKDSIISNFRRYFFQEGESENKDVIIKYNINKIKIDTQSSENKSIYDSDENLENELDIMNIKKQVINLMNKFDEAFGKEDKKLLVSAIKDLNFFSHKFRFTYVFEMTLDWLKILEDKSYEKKSLKNFGYYNQIREIMDKMLKEIKNKIDMLIIYKEKKIKKNKEDEHYDKEEVIINKQNLAKKQSINKEDLLKMKEIIPIKLDIDIQSKLSLEEIQNIMKNLEKGEFGNQANKDNKSSFHHKKISKSHFNNRNDNEIEAFAYPFTEESLCNIF